MKYCSKCGTEVSDDTRYCPKCGEMIQTTGNQGNGYNNDGNKKLLIVLASVFAVVVVVCIAVVLIIVTRDNQHGSIDTASTIVANGSTASSYTTEESRYKSLKQRFNAAKLKAANNGVKVNKEKNAAKEALDQYEDAIDDNDASLMAQYGNEAEKYVSQLESATNKAKKTKKKSKNEYNIPESEKTNYVVDPSFRVDRFYFDNLVSLDRDRYGATVLAINEYYARKGCKFKTDSLQEYFEHQRWYENKGKSTTNVSLSSLEKHNIKMFQEDREWYKRNLSGATANASDFSCQEFLDIAEMVTH